MKTAVRTLTFELGEEQIEYIDLAECLSQVNRQAYRQGFVYLVESFSWSGAGGAPGPMHMRCLPTSWTVYQSWKKAKRLWDKMNRQAHVAYPAYHDYKVFFDAAHYVGHTSVTSNLLPRDGGGVLFSNIGREWVYAQYVTPTAGGSAAPGENACHMLGDDTTVNNAYMSTDGSSAIIQGYGDTRPTVGLEEPQMPGDASDSWQTELFDTGEVMPELINHLEGKNDQPPYAHALDAQGGDNPIYVGGSESGQTGHDLIRLEPVATETVYGPGGEVPLGLLAVAGLQTGTLTVHLAPGAYQGIAAMPMGKVQT